MIIYNKIFQKIFGVDIKNYKILSGKYSTVKKNGNGKGRVYILKTKRLIFEGEFLNGKKNGKGKEFDEENHLIFYGEYLDGKFWNGIGKAKNDNNHSDSDNDDSLFFEYINGKKYQIEI